MVRAGIPGAGPDFMSRVASRPDRNRRVFFFWVGLYSRRGSQSLDILLRDRSGFPSDLKHCLVFLSRCGGTEVPLGFSESREARNRRGRVGGLNKTEIFAGFEFEGWHGGGST